MATSGLMREVVAGEVPPPGVVAATRQPVEQPPWNLLFRPVLIEQVVMPVTRQEYQAAERVLALPTNRDESVDCEFDAILKMKTDPLVLRDDEVEVYTRLRQGRARRVGKPLPLE
jgi:hypothetical protein